MDQEQAKQVVVAELPLKQLYRASFCPLPDLSYFLTHDEDELMVWVVQEVKQAA